eukprot:jgi/Ulvmu1/4246/UM192_0006.1
MPRTRHRRYGMSAFGTISWPRAMLSILLAVVIQLPSCESVVQDESGDMLIGWGGATYDPRETFGIEPTAPVKVSDKPLAYVWKNFISRREARHIAELALPQLRQSRVGDNQEATDIRSSYGMFIPRYQDEIVAAVEERVANWTGLPVVNQEGIQVLRYSPGQKYKKHMDAHGRLATILIYLSDTEVGGEMAFPETTDAHWTDISLKPAGLSPDCAEGHVAVKPEVGTALLFYSMAPGAEADETLRTPDPFSLHTGCPPAEGQIKWTSTIWVHFDPFRPEEYSTDYPKEPMWDIGRCDNADPHCDMWAERGECNNSAQYMVGANGGTPHCLKACKVCTPCAHADHACDIANRERLGLLGDLDAEVASLFSAQ